MIDRDVFSDIDLALYTYINIIVFPRELKIALHVKEGLFICDHF